MNFNSLPVKPLRITSRFGPRNTGIKGASTYHKGIDLGGKGSDTPIYAVKRGVISQSYWNKVRGWVVLIKHDNQYTTLYQHLKAKSPLPVGTKVQAGQQIGIMGNTSETIKCGVHLHMELRLNGTPINPEPYLLNIKGVEEDMTETELRAIIKEEINAALSGKNTETSTWAAEPWAWGKDVGITDGTRPGGFTTREQVVTMMSRIMKGR